MKKIKTSVDPRIIELEKSYLLPFPQKLKLLLSELITKGVGDHSEWQGSPKDFEFAFFDKDEKKNRFEELILRDQKNYLGTSLPEIFSNTVFLGNLGNGDSYLADIGSTVVNKSNEVEVVLFDHETHDIELAFSKNTMAFIEANKLLDQVQDEENPLADKELKKVMTKLKHELNLSWHFEDLEEKSGIKPSFKSSLTSKYFLYRSLWLIYLFRQDGVRKMSDIPELFRLVKQDVIQDDQVKEYLERVVSAGKRAVSGCYWMWYIFFLGKDEELKKYLHVIVDKTTSSMVRDSALLLKEILDGRKKIGKIKDIYELRKQFLALDLDPAREEERKKEQTVSARTAQEKKGTDAELAKGLITKNKLSVLPDLAWEHISSPVIVEALFAHLRAKDKSLAIDFARFDYLKEQKASRKNSYYDFENEEIFYALFEEKSKLSALLYIHEFTKGVNNVLAVKEALKNLEKYRSWDDFNDYRSLQLLQKIATPEVEEIILRLVPTPSTGDDISHNTDIELALKELIPILANIRSTKVVPLLLQHIEALQKRIEDKNKDGSPTKNSWRAKMMLDEHILPYLIFAIRKIRDPKNAHYLVPFKNSPLQSAVYAALIELGDKTVAKELFEKSKTQFGDPIMLIHSRVIADYALYKSGKAPGIENALFALQVVLAEKEKASDLHAKAIELIAAYAPKAQAIKLITPFIDAEQKEVRTVAIEQLQKLGEKIIPVYADRGYLEYLYKKGGKKALLELLSKKNTIFKYEILRKLAEEKDCAGAEKWALKAVQEMVRFDYYTKGYIIDSFKKTDYAIYALAEMKNKVIDDYLYSLMTHPNVMYRQNDLFKYKNYDHSAYLTKLMKTEPEIRTISEKVPELIVTDVATASKGGSAKWVLSGNTNGVAWSNDGTYLATAGQYSAFFTPEGEEKKLLDKTRWAYDVDFSPSEKLVAIAYHGDTIGIYDTKTGKLLHNFKEHEGVPQGVRKIKFSPDGKQLASVSNDRSLIVRDAATGYNLHTIEFTSDANTVAWLPEKDRLIVGTDKNLHLINIQTDSIVKSVNFDGVAEIQVLSKGKDYFIVAGGSGGLVIFNKKLTVVHKFAAKNIARIRFSVDQKTMYTLCWEDKKNGLWMWDLKTYKAKKAEGCAIGKGYAMDIRRSDGTIAIAGSSGLVQLFDKNLQLLTKSASIAFHKNTVYALAYSGTRKTLYSADADGGVIAWSEGEASKTVFFEKGISLIESLVLSPDEKFLFIGANKKIIRLDLDASRYHAIPTEDRCRALIADGETVFAAATTWVLKIDKQGRVKQSDTYSPTMHNAALLTKQNIFIGGGFLKETLTLWNATTLKQLRSFNVPVKERSDGVYDICLTSDEKLLYTSGSDGVIRVYSTSTWEIIKTLVEVSSKDHIACNENNTLLATASDSIVSLYETKSFKKIGQARLPANVSALLFVHNVLIIGLLTGKIMKIVIKHL